MRRIQRDQELRLTLTTPRKENSRFKECGCLVCSPLSDDSEGILKGNQPGSFALGHTNGYCTQDCMHIKLVYVGVSRQHANAQRIVTWVHIAVRLFAVPALWNIKPTMNSIFPKAWRRVLPLGSLELFS